jgi:cysteine desulfurase/selenocysteine lyase
MNIGDTIALGAAIDYVQAIGFDVIAAHSRELVREATRLLGEIPGTKIYGPSPEERGGIVAFTLDDIHAHDIATVLDHEGVAVRAGHHCAMPLHTKLGVSATTRASFYVYNLPSDIATMAEGVRKAKQLFSR